YAIFLFFAKRGLDTSMVESKYKYKVAHWLEELARTSLTFKLAGETNFHLHRTDKDVSGYLEARENHFQVLVRQYSLLVLVKVLVATGLLAIGGILVMQQLMNIGQFVAAEIIILLVIGSVEKLILSLETIYDVLTSLEKIGQVTDLELENGHGLNMIDQCGTAGMCVDLHQVDFTYPGNNFKALNKVNLSIQDGEKWAITGFNHSGKSTLLHVLAGLFDVQEGTISYNGLPKDNLELITLRSVIGDLLSEEQLFDGTVLDNIAMGRVGATFDNVKWAVHELGLDGFIRSLPQGYNTYIDPLGSKLPDSVIQKLLIARSIADRPKLLLLEDPFEHIDEKEKREIIDFLTSEKNGWTMVAVSSDPYLISRTDKIAVMEKGRIIQVKESNKTEDTN
ncbi:MAG: ATP-binding cassette domain-containing protein, partial [Bacteroidetes bacterium]|nr:ATP-binding cassette domain-containing protein [Bacteroidota bacterium]